MKVSKNKKNRRNILIGSTAFLVIAVIGVFALETLGITSFFSGSETPPSTPTTTNTTSEDTTSVNEGQDQTQSEQDSIKENSAISSNGTNSNSTGNTSKKSVTPVITSADSSRVFGYVPGVVENGGTCTFTFSGNGNSVKKSQGVADVSKTICATTPPSGSGWSVVLSYTSSTASGASQKVKVN